MIKPLSEEESVRSIQSTCSLGGRLRTEVSAGVRLVSLSRAICAKAASWASWEKAPPPAPPACAG